MKTTMPFWPFVVQGPGICHYQLPLPRQQHAFCLLPPAMRPRVVANATVPLCAADMDGVWKPVLVCHNCYRIVTVQIQVTSQHDVRPASSFAAPRRGRRDPLSVHVPNTRLLGFCAGSCRVARNAAVPRFVSVDVQGGDKPLSPGVPHREI